MTEAAWLACDDPRGMLEWVLGRGASDRKLRLFTCALARVSPTPVVVEAFEKIERLDGLKGTGGISEDPPEMARQWAAALLDWLAPPPSRAALVRDIFRWSLP